MDDVSHGGGTELTLYSSCITVNQGHGSASSQVSEWCLHK